MIAGLTSVTFRSRTAEEIINIAKNAALGGIEWGADVHVPPNDLANAKKILNLTIKQGLRVLSYGSYFRAENGEDFLPILETAKTINAPIIRIWAGSKKPYEITPQEFTDLVCAIKKAGEMAASKGITVALEYHRNTMTETAEGAARLLTAVNCNNVKTYWQPNPELSFNEHLNEIELLLPWIVSYHVFCWEHDNTRLLLAQGTQQWEQYIKKAVSINPNLILEFVKDDSEENFLKDAKTLNDLIGRI